ncbi:MAG: hypothetical protein HRT92_10280 [Piscirickettsiaceae bacterium]|nr:hypothetical protein [Piscirickettsiaceae bacterium]
MRIEFDSHLFIWITILFIVMWLITHRAQYRKTFITLTGFIGALLMPAFVPGHGEFIMLLPNASLFTQENKVSWGIGLFFLVLNFFIISKILNRISRTAAT